VSVIVGVRRDRIVIGRWSSGDWLGSTIESASALKPSINTWKLKDGVAVITLLIPDFDFLDAEELPPELFPAFFDEFLATSLIFKK